MFIHRRSQSFFSALKIDVLVIFLVFSALYIALVWLVNGGDRWWVIDFMGHSNVFYGDDAYRFFLARSAWINPDLYTYNFVLPGFLVLDGLVVTLAGGDLFWSRCIHGVLASVALCLIWSAGRRLGINRFVMLLAVLVMGLLPRYAVMSLSFYGEVWLTFALCLLLWLFVSRYWWGVALVASVLPLIRPEGLFFLIPLWFFMLKQRCWRQMAWMVLPGFLYFVFLNIHFDSLNDYNYWRHELRLILGRLVLNSSKWDIEESYSMLYVVPSALGILYAPIRRLWPVLLTTAFWIFWLQFELYRGALTYEDRYVYILIPILTLLWAAFFAWLWEKTPHIILPSYAKGISLGIFFSFLMLLHYLQIAEIRVKIRQHGLYWTVERMYKWEWDRIFPSYTPVQVLAWHLFDRKIEELLAKDKGIDKVVLFDHELYYFLDPYAIPRHVTVGYPTNGYAVFHLLLDGQVFIQHHGGKMYSYLQYGKPDFRKGERRVLYADLMPLRGYPFAWKMAGYELYLFSYLESRKPQKDLTKSRMLTPTEVEGVYQQWRLGQYGMSP